MHGPDSGLWSDHGFGPGSGYRSRFDSDLVHMPQVGSASVSQVLRAAVPGLEPGPVHVIELLLVLGPGYELWFALDSGSIREPGSEL